MVLPRFSGILPKLAVVGAILIALAIAAAAIYFIAYNKGESQAEIQIGEYEKNLAELNSKLVARQSEATQTIIREYHTNTIERERVVMQNAQTIPTTVPDRAELSEGWIYAHNQAASGQLIDPALASNSEPSETHATEALQIIASNYDLAQANADQLTALQRWVREQEKISEETTVGR